MGLRRLRSFRNLDADLLVRETVGIYQILLDGLGVAPSGQAYFDLVARRFAGGVLSVGLHSHPQVSWPKNS